MFAPEGQLPLASYGALTLAPEGDLLSSPEGISSLPPSRNIDSVPEGDNNVDNDNGTASGQPRRNCRAPTKYNYKTNSPVSQWVKYQHASVAKFVLDSSIYGTFSMDSWGEIQGILAYQAVDNSTLTPVWFVD